MTYTVKIKIEQPNGTTKRETFWNVEERDLEDIRKEARRKTSLGACYSVKVTEN